MRVSVNPEVQPPLRLTAESLDELQLSTGLSNNKFKKVVTLIREKAGKQSIPANFSQHISEKGKTLERYYQTSHLEFDVSDKIKEFRPVVWADPSQLVDAVIEERGLIGFYKILVSADGGQGSFKICLTITSTPENSGENEPDNPSTSSTRSLRSSTAAKKSKETSVNRLLILCIVPDIKETHFNFKTLVDLTKGIAG